MQRHYAQSSLQDICRLTEQNIADSASFLQTGSTWIRELAIDNMSNWSRISLLTTELILNTMAHLHYFSRKLNESGGFNGVKACSS